MDREKKESANERKQKNGTTPNNFSEQLSESKPRELSLHSHETVGEEGESPVSSPRRGRLSRPSARAPQSRSKCVPSEISSRDNRAESLERVSRESRESLERESVRVCVSSESRERERVPKGRVRESLELLKRGSGRRERESQEGERASKRE